MIMLGSCRNQPGSDVICKSLVKHLHQIRPSATVGRNVPSLPPEVWMIIAEFIDPLDLETLTGVSHVFYEIVMDKRYREFKLIESDVLQFFRKIDRLK